MHVAQPRVAAALLTLWVCLVATLAMVATACAGPTQAPATPPATSPAGPTSVPPRPASTSTEQPATVPTAGPAVPARVPTAASAPALKAAPRIEVQTVVSGLDTPWAIDFAPDGRMFVTERPGRVRVVKDGVLQPQPWATLRVLEQGESGLMGLALDPEFAENGLAYVAYTYRAADGRVLNRLARLREDSASGQGMEDRVLVDGMRGANIHDGARVRFGPDGKLYFTMGDASDSSLAQDRSSLNGKIFRLETDGRPPADNPFPGSLVYSFGHRNPQGLAWQPGSGRLYATEHGPSGSPSCCRDEVNLIEPGKNYGWPLVTGDQSRDGLVSPVLQSGNSETWAPGGATFVTRGPWAGSLLFTGLRGQALYRVVLDPTDPEKVASFERLLQGQFGRLRDIVEGPDGALYLATSNHDGRGSPAPEDDRVLRIVPPGAG